VTVAGNETLVARLAITVTFFRHTKWLWWIFHRTYLREIGTTKGAVGSGISTLEDSLVLLEGFPSGELSAEHIPTRTFPRPQGIGIEEDDVRGLLAACRLRY